MNEGMRSMIQIENAGDGKIRFATKNPTVVEVLLVEGKLFVHSEPLPNKTATPPTFTSKPESEEKELNFLKESKTS